MAYIKYTWKSGDLVSPSKINNIENAIDEQSKLIDTLTESIYKLSNSMNAINVAMEELKKKLDNMTPSEPSPSPEEPPKLTKFHSGVQLVAIGRSYWIEREQYLTYGFNNVMSKKTWSEVTVDGADSPDGKYRNLDCSGFVGACLLGVIYNEFYKNQTVYESKDYTPRTSKYPWARTVPRTAADMCQHFETNYSNMILPPTEWHSTKNDGTELLFGNLQPGDLIFFGGKDNDRYKGVYHVALAYGLNSQGVPSLIEVTSDSNVSNHTDGKTYGCQITGITKKSYSKICTIIRLQGVGATLTIPSGTKGTVQTTTSTPLKNEDDSSSGVSIPKRSTVTINSYQASTGRYKITYNGSTGYIDARFVTIN